MANRKMVGNRLGWLLGLALFVLLPSMARAQLETVKLGDLAAISNAAIYIAIEKGFFKEQGVNTEITNFDSAAKMVPALVAGELEVSVRERDGAIVVITRDNGRGLPPIEQLNKSRTLGWNLITLLVRQIDGKLEVLEDRPGTNIRITFSRF